MKEQDNFIISREDFNLSFHPMEAPFNKTRDKEIIKCKFCDYRDRNKNLGTFLGQLTSSELQNIVADVLSAIIENDPTRFDHTPIMIEARWNKEDKYSLIDIFLHFLDPVDYIYQQGMFKMPHKSSKIRVARLGNFCVICRGAKSVEEANKIFPYDMYQIFGDQYLKCFENISDNEQNILLNLYYKFLTESISEDSKNIFKPKVPIKRVIKSKYFGELSAYKEDVYPNSQQEKK